MEDANRVSRRMVLAAGAGLASDIATAPVGPRVTHRIPIKDFRAPHRQPFVHSELVMPVYEAYRSKYLADKARWPKWSVAKGSCPCLLT